MPPVPPPPELRRIAELVGRGLLPQAESNACLHAWNTVQKAGRDVPLCDFFVKAKLLTATQAAVLARESLLQRQPFAKSPNTGYRLLRQVGEGGMAIVFEATYLPVMARVALKVLDTQFCLLEKDRLRFKREFGILSRLEHENIVEGLEWDTVDGVDYFAMSYVDGISLLDLLDKGVRLSEPLCLHVAVQVASALDHMHRKGIVHRDVKPANFVLDHTGTVRMIDFGLAKVMAGMRQDTTDDTTVGTPEYMSPEQARGSAAVDSRSDLYGLGCSLFHMLTGELPFKGTGQEVIYAQVMKPVEFTAAQGARVSPPVQYVVRKMMAKAPGDRYQSGQALLDELNVLCAAILAKPIAVPDEVHAATVESAPIPAKSAPVLRRPTGRLAHDRRLRRHPRR